MKRWILRGVAVALLGTATVLGASTGCATWGGDVEGARLKAVQASPNHNGKVFVNERPIVDAMEDNKWNMVSDWLGGDQIRSPEGKLPLVRPSAAALRAPSEPSLSVTWMGHSTVLIEIDGAFVLTDPIWSDKASPSTLVGPTRFHEPPVALADLPKLDAVIISHDHYDHLDHQSIVQLAKTGVPFVVPLGVGAHLEHWGVPNAQIIERDWWGRWTTAHGIELVCTPAQHFSGRSLTDKNETLWASWAVKGPRHRIYFGGDTGFFDGFTVIGKREGPFDMSLMPIGAYNKLWADVHLDPEQAVEAHKRVGGGVLVPIHWGTFQLAFHDWYEPVERLMRAAETDQIPIALPIVGERVVLGQTPTIRWWNVAKVADDG